MNGLMRRIEKENDANNDEDKVPYVNQGEEVRGRLEKTEYTIVCL